MFPLFILGRFFVELQVAVIPAGLNVPGLGGLAQGAARLFPVGAVVELAPPQVGGEIREGILKVLLQYNIHLVRIKGREPRSIHHEGLSVQCEQLHMAGGVPPPAQLLGDLAGRQVHSRGQGIEDAALAHAGVAGEGGELALEGFSELLHSRPGLGAGGDHPKAGVTVDPHQLACLIQVRFIDAKKGLYPFVSRNGRHPVDEEGLRNGVHIGGENHQRVHVGYRRTDKAVLSGQDLLDHAFALGFCHGDQVPGQRA